MMTPHKRIVYNTAATYGRSLLALVLGLFSSRWILLALGKSDFGLYGVVGGIISIVSFLDTVLRASVSRFYAYTIGSRNSFSSEELYDEEMCRWFNTALSLHLCLAIIIVATAVPVCYYMIKHVLVIPEERIDTCMIVAFVSIMSTAVSCLSVPYSAMFNAHQLIAELTFFDLIRVIGMFVGSYLLLYVKSDRLIAYSVLVAFFTVGISIVLMVLAWMRFSSVRIRYNMLYCPKYMRRIGKYAGWKLFGVWGWSLRQNGSIFLINIFFGPIANAAFSVASQFAAQAATLSSSLMTALTPALTTIAGSGDSDKLRAYTIKACKFPVLLLIMFLCPLCLEIDYVLELWLKNPPELAATICICMAGIMLINMMTSGLIAALSADGRIKGWQIAEFIIMVVSLPTTFFAYRFGSPFIAVGIILIIDAVLLATVRLWYSRKLIGIGFRDIVGSVIAPCVSVGCLAIVPCAIVRIMLKEGFLRLVAVAGSSCVAVLLLSWLFALTQGERCLLRSYLKGKIR